MTKASWLTLWPLCVYVVICLPLYKSGTLAEFVAT